MTNVIREHVYATATETYRVAVPDATFGQIMRAATDGLVRTATGLAVEGPRLDLGLSVALSGQPLSDIKSLLQVLQDPSRSAHRVADAVRTLRGGMGQAI